MTDRATHGDEGQLRELWKLVFGDSDRFLDIFFRELFRPEGCLVTRSDGKITSMLFMLEGTWSDRNDYPMRYIYACATHPGYRRRGLMGELLQEAVRYAEENGLELSLVPENEELREYYRRFGFTKDTYLYKRKYPPLAAPKDASVWTAYQDRENAAKLLTDLRTRFWRGKNAILWPEAHQRVTLEELFWQGGELVVMKTGGALPSGYALALPQDGTVEIVECASALSQDDTVTSLRNHYRDKTTLFTLSDGVADSCAETTYAQLHTTRTGEVPYLNLALDL